MPVTAKSSVFFFELRNGTRGRLRKCPITWTLQHAQLALEAQGLDWSDVWHATDTNRRHSRLAARQQQISAEALLEIWVPPKPEIVMG